MAITPVDPIVITGASVALFIGPLSAPAVAPATEVPVSRMEITKTAGDTEVTGSTSVASGRVWQEFGEGASGGTFSWDGHLRVGQTIQPAAVQQGRTYKIAMYIRRPGWNGPADIGSAYVFNGKIDSNNAALVPKDGSIPWKVSGKVNGVILDPT